MVFPLPTPGHAGEWLLVTAAAGGVGMAAVQLGKGSSSVFFCVPRQRKETILPAMGAKVIAAAGSQGKLDICKKFGGADYGINYTKRDWQQEVLKLTGGKGVDVVYDPVGLIVGMFSGTCYYIYIYILILASPDSLKCTAWKGRALVVGFAAGKIEKVRHLQHHVTTCRTKAWHSCLLT